KALYFPRFKMKKSANIMAPIGGSAEPNTVKKSTKCVYNHIEPNVPINPLNKTTFLRENFVILEIPKLDAYKALSLVVQIFKPKTIIAGKIKFCINITSDISAWQVAIEPTAPNKNINVFPMKKAIIVAITADDFFFENRVKSGVNVPALIKEPIQIVKAAAKPICSAGE